MKETNFKWCSFDTFQIILSYLSYPEAVTYKMTNMCIPYICKMLLSGINRLSRPGNIQKLLNSITGGGYDSYNDTFIGVLLSVTLTHSTPLKSSYSIYMYVI